MAYGLGIDVGTTLTSAALGRGAREEMLSLGEATLLVPSIVVAETDGTLLTGDKAARRAETEPGRAVRDFKGRVGDPTPVVLGGNSYSPMDLMAAITRDVVAAARAATDGEEPAATVLTCPAIWGPYRREQVTEVPTLAGLETWRVVSEPEAVAAFYLSRQPPSPRGLVAVYDLGGATCDTAVLRDTGHGWELVGTAEGVDGAGGVDIDSAVLGIVDDVLHGAVSRLDRGKPEQATLLARLQIATVRAKEALSSEPEVTVPVLLPGGPPR